MTSFEEGQRFIVDTSVPPLAPQEMMTVLEGRTIVKMRRLESSTGNATQLTLDNGESYVLVANVAQGSDLKVVAPNMLVGSTPLAVAGSYRTDDLEYLELWDVDNDVTLTFAATVARDDERPAMYLQRVISVDG